MKIVRILLIAGLLAGCGSDGDETATINWSAKVQGQETPISQTARLVDGEWKLVDVTN